MSELLQLSVHLCPQNDLVLDLWKGFSAPVRICFDNNGDKPVACEFPFLIKSDGKTENDEIDIIRALSHGTLEIQDEMGNTISTDCVSVLEPPELTNVLWYFRSHEKIVYPLASPASNLLRLFRSMLKAGRTYYLHLSQKNLEKWSPLTVHGNECPKWFPPLSLLDSLDGLTSIPFSVISGRPIPRFTIALSTSSFICSLSGAPKFRITLKTTSISEQSITVALCLDSYVKVKPQTITYKWKNGGFQSLFSIKDSKSQVAVKIAKRERRDKLVSCETFSSAEDFIHFRKGTQHVRHMVFDRADLDQFRPGHSYEMKLKPQGFATWHYGLKCKKVKAYWTTEWCKNGPILFEPVSAAGSATEAFLEREKPMPFFRLPVEIRNHIYDCLKFHVEADIVRFKVTS